MNDKHRLKRVADILANLGDASTKKAVMKRTADALEKIAIAGIALGMYQNRTEGIWIAGIFLVASYVFTIWETRK